MKVLLFKTTVFISLLIIFVVNKIEENQNQTKTRRQTLVDKTKGLFIIHLDLKRFHQPKYINKKSSTNYRKGKEMKNWVLSLNYINKKSTI